LLPLGTISDPELVIGLVGRIGLDTRLVSKKIAEVLSEYGYETIPIKISGLVPDLEQLPKPVDHPLEAYYSSRIAACNKLREIAQRNDILACLAVMKIRDLRKDAHGDEDVPRRRVAYIVDQIKRPEETALLRQIYRDFYVQISCHAPRDIRERRLAHKIASSHPENPREEIWRATAAQLIGRDDAEEDEKTGQRVREAFPLADVIVNASEETNLTEELDRFFEIFFGKPTRSPTIDEYGMALAFNASLRSIDMSRQVGAAIISNDGEIFSLGCNEVPKAGGGIYGDGAKHDARDATLGEDQNTRRKRLMVTDVVVRLAKKGLAPERFLKTSVDEIEKELIDDRDAPLKDSMVLDSLEYGRMLHAEMCAISEAARTGTPLQDEFLYCTAFPCHNCAKHIVGVGLKSVVYLQPYPKSHVSELYPDSIEIDPETASENKVPFRQFIGLAPARYYLFEKDRLKDDSGRIRAWDKRLAHPTSRQAIPLQGDVEKFALNRLKPFLEKIRPPATPPAPSSSARP
jgi:cytidine deaminase